MNSLLFYNDKDWAQGIWTDNQDAAQIVADAVKAAGYKVVWMVHGHDSVRPMTGYEDAYKRWLDDRE